MNQQLPADAKKSIRKATHLLREGNVVAFPTEMGYVLGANAFERFALRQLREIAGLPAGEGLTIFIYQIDDLNLVVKDVPNRAWALLQQFWPGPLIVILPKTDELPAEVTGGKEFVAVCSPGQPTSLDLVIKLGRPLATANPLRWPPAFPTLQAVTQQCGESVPLILDDDPLRSEPATIIDLSVAPPRCWQRGVIPLDQVRQYLPDLEEK